MVKHEQRNQVVLRVLKFLKPPNPDDAVVQKEGEPLKRYDPAQKIESVWMAKTTSKYLTPSFLEPLEQRYLTGDSR